MGLVIVVHGLSCSRPGSICFGLRFEPMAPALAGIFLTTGPLVKSHPLVSNYVYFRLCNKFHVTFTAVGRVFILEQGVSC